MVEPLTEAMAAVARRCDYADARRVACKTEWIVTRNGRVERVASSDTDGIGVRVRARGAWGFAATGDVSPAAVERALGSALAVTQRQPSAPASPLAPAPPASGHWEGPCRLDPFTISLEDKVDLLLGSTTAMHTDPRIVRAHAECLSVRTTKAFASTEGGACTQVLTECGAGIEATAVDSNELQTRSYPSQHGGSLAAAGWEHVRELNLTAHAPRVAEEALALLAAPECPAGTATVVLHGEQVAIQIHESIGHALELDRILGGEASYAGTSWVAPSDLGSLRYGSELLDVTADATLPGGLGSFGWDDEGVEAKVLPLIRGGVLLGALSSRDSAAAIGLAESGGCARAEGFARQPIVRMTNVSLEPGEAGTLGDLIAATDRGFYLEGNRSWSIDDRRLQFRFGTELAREIVGGELGRLYRNPSYAGVTPNFWGGMDAVCSRPAWRPWSVANCGKGEPGQTARVSHGTAPARFRDVDVGAA